jgi:hypothetical protein
MQRAAVRGLSALMAGSALLVGSSSLPGCAAGPRPCRSSVACASGSECLANRCLSVGDEPVAAGSTRLLLEPLSVAVVREAGAAGPLPSSVSFGATTGRSEQLLVRFPDARSQLDVDAAFLLLQPMADADPTGSDIEVEVTRAAAPWASGTLQQAPPHAGPSSIGLARTRPPSVLRIDVTALIRASTPRGSSDHGLLVRALSSGVRAAAYSTGSDGDAPRLDVYGSVRAAAR